MGFENAMMKRWMGRKSPESVAGMMKEMMPMMMEKMGPERMANMMTDMPDMMEGPFEMMKPEDMERMMHDAMPKIMDHCLSRMNDNQRRSMLAMCRESLDQIERKFLATSLTKE